MVTVACVYKKGGDFNDQYVNALAESVKRHIKREYRFVCLTDSDQDLGCETMPLIHALPGWWSKLEAFRLISPTVLLDLDTILVGDITPIADAAENIDAVVMLSGFRHKDWCSGVMAWNRDLSFIIKRFVSLVDHSRNQFFDRANALRARLGNKIYRGDQDWVCECLESKKMPIVAAQCIQKGIVSFKNHVREDPEILKKSSIVCFHGKPRPHELIKHKWIRDHFLVDRETVQTN